MRTLQRMVQVQDAPGAFLLEQLSSTFASKASSRGVGGMTVSGFILAIAMAMFFAFVVGFVEGRDRERRRWQERELSRGRRGVA
jgi:hypothetical protein